MHNPLSIGFDLETGGHVFQLHFTNSKGMNERAFLAATEYKWGDGDIFFRIQHFAVFSDKEEEGLGSSSAPLAVRCSLFADYTYNGE